MVVPFAVPQTIPPQTFDALQWRMIGPFRGGRVVAVAGIPGDSATAYFGAVGGGLWKSPNAGITWEPIFDGQPIASIGAIAIAPSNPNVIYARNRRVGHSLRLCPPATACTSPPTAARVGQTLACAIRARSAASWSIRAIRTWFTSLPWATPTGPTKSAAFSSRPTAARRGRKCFTKDRRSARRTWRSPPAIQPCSSPECGSALVRRGAPTLPWKGRAAGSIAPPTAEPRGLELTGHGLPDGQWGRVGVTVAPDGKRVYALIDAGKKSGLYRSDDGGDNWTLANSDPRLTSRAWYFNWLAVDPSNPDVVYIPNVAFYRSEDGGKTISIVRGAPGGDDYHDIWVDPKNSNHLILGSDQGTTHQPRSRQDLVALVQPAHRADVPRHHRQPVSLRRLWRAAGHRQHRHL